MLHPAAGDIRFFLSGRMANNANSPKYVATLVDKTDGEKYYVMPDNTTSWDRPANNQGYTFLPEGWFTVQRDGVMKFKKQGTTTIRNNAPTNSNNAAVNNKGHAMGVLMDQITNLETAIKNVTKKANNVTAKAANNASPAEGGKRRGRKTRARSKKNRRAHSRRRR